MSAALGLAAEAQEPLPSFSACLDTEIARFERDLRRAAGSDVFDIGDVRGVDYCGSVGIVRCDRTGDRVPCQHAFAAEQDAVTERVLDSLPGPSEVAGRAGAWSDGLYPRLWALAHGRSAGPDCAGATPVFEAWCEAREANRRLAAAVHAWQLARFLGAADPATAAGWADPAAPTRPVARQDAP